MCDSHHAIEASVDAQGYATEMLRLARRWVEIESERARLLQIREAMCAAEPVAACVGPR